ncbi:DNA replication complex GINS protein PSF3-like [Styela clava]|uniref:DNA replication complex GINS protein PSF3-like n=1 Tax=Styela clava TaxID=7725 RepID=UPI001939EB02|nr:DNA replication complex GINS protein PSF3-like [Styela clava]
MDCAPPSGSLKQNYFSIDDILMSSEKVPCSFLLPVFGLGFLDPGSGKKDITEGTKMDLPLWLASSLGANPKRKLVSVEITKPYREVYREILKADASVVDLHKLGPYYYAMGQQMLVFNADESVFVARSLVQAFADRFRRIMDWSTNAFKFDSNRHKEKLDEVERNLFEVGQKSLHSHMKWEVGTSHKLTASEMVIRHRKRKRDAE